MCVQTPIDRSTLKRINPDDVTNAIAAKYPMSPHRLVWQVSLSWKCARRDEHAMVHVVRLPAVHGRRRGLPVAQQQRQCAGIANLLLSSKGLGVQSVLQGASATNTFGTLHPDRIPDVTMMTQPGVIYTDRIRGEAAWSLSFLPASKSVGSITFLFYIRGSAECCLFMQHGGCSHGKTPCPAEKPPLACKASTC